MTDFAEALQGKIDELVAEKERLEEELEHIDTKLGVLLELMGEEDGVPVANSKRKPGRPKGSGKKKTSKKVSSAPAKKLSPEQEDLIREANAALESRGGGTDPELAKRIANRFSPAPRPVHSYGDSVKIQSKANVRKKMAGESTED